MRIDTALLLAAALFAAPACKHKQDTKVVDPGDQTGTSDRSGGGGATSDGATTTVTGDDGASMPSFAAVYFEFDSSTLSTDAQKELDDLAAWLQKHPKAKIKIEGNTDERGTDEYNIGLGQRRAQMIESYLARIGVEESRLDTISYGEERPADEGHDESAWAKNRRGDFVPGQ